ncbi:hypothetical protein BS17DRAFT_765177 [Gyrodon lividus]|nr:hypothetical protein BS17DRAFT_765177 [Gyrodon lividus]
MQRELFFRVIPILLPSIWDFCLVKHVVENEAPAWVVLVTSPSIDGLPHSNVCHSPFPLLLPSPSILTNSLYCTEIVHYYVLHPLLTFLKLPDGVWGGVAVSGVLLLMGMVHSFHSSKNNWHIPQQI